MLRHFHFNAAKVIEIPMHQAELELEGTPEEVHSCLPYSGAEDAVLMMQMIPMQAIPMVQEAVPTATKQLHHLQSLLSSEIYLNSPLGHRPIPTPIQIPIPSIKFGLAHESSHSTS
mmetsp:Transcript_2675/g.4271  ORF Transcript_2675/g.4271 Transcript_2675/m.4271 type:complete len:116 (+) Transcript_2675:46-393(+)